MRQAILILSLFLSLAASAQKPFIRDFSLNEAASNVKVNALVQDSIGYIWIATDNGLLRFNGRSFVKIEDSLHKSVTSLLLHNGNVLAGYSNGKIGKVSNSSVQLMNIRNGPKSVITSLCFTGDTLWAGTEDEGVFVIAKNVARSLNKSKGLSDNFIYDLAASNDNILAGSDIGINDIAIVNGNPQLHNYTTRQGLPDNIVSVIKKIPGSQLYLIGTQEGGLALFDANNKKSTPLSLPIEKWRYGQINDILIINSGRVWVATSSGYLIELNTIAGDKTELHPYYYPGKNFRKLLLDKAGNIWCATTQGVTMMTGEYLLGLKLTKPYELQDVTAMIWSDNILWLALKHDLYHISLSDSMPRMAHVFTAKANITTLYSDAKGRLWIGTLGDGLYYQQSRYDVVKVKDIDEPGDDANVLSITGTDTSLWIAGLKGVDELSMPQNGKVKLLKHHGKKTGIGSDYVYQLYPDDKGNIWMATDGAGVCMYDGASYHHWANSFGADSRIAYSITEDKYGDMWAATMYKDLYHYHNNVWENLRLPETQYPDINISAVMANATGQVVSVYQRCIDEWYPRSRYFRHFNSALGMDIDSTSDVLNCASRDKDGNIFVPYQGGILVFRNQDNVYDIRPAVHILSPTLFSRPIANNKHEFAHDENYLGFTFDGIGFSNHERLNYRYILEGYNDNWINTRDASVSFPKLSPGKYKFYVQVSLNPAFDHPLEDSYSFTIATPFWHTIPFYIIVGLAAILIGYSYIKLREKQLKRIAQLRQDRLMFEYEHLKSQVNPHFLFNSLYVLAILIEEKKENALSYTVHLADLYRNMLATASKDIIPLGEEIELLMNYVNIQQTRFEDALHVVIDVPDNVKQTKKIIPLALQLLVENAIKHNVVSVSNPLTIYITASAGEIVVRNVIQPKISQPKGAGIGLINIKKRYQLLTKKPITYGIFGNEYIVVIPLL